MKVTDDLTIKTGELLARTEELREVNESLLLLNNDTKKRIQEISNANRDIADKERDLIVVNNELIIANEKLALTNKELEIINKELIVANEQIKQLIIKEKECIAIIGHELRTPIQALSANFELIDLDIPWLLQNSIGHKDKTNKEFESLLKDRPRLEQLSNRLISTYRNSQRLEILINNILDLTKIDSNRLQLHKESFNLNEKIQNVIKDVRNKAILSSQHANLMSTPIDIIFEPPLDPIIVFADKEFMKLFQTY